jgi:D-tyrosyl-tRNA(Tyr) deacylase
MRVVVQRSGKAKLKSDGKDYSSIEKGLMVLVGFTEGDGLDEIKWMVNKIVNLRIFDDEEGVMNKSILDVGGEILSVSQFTLYGDCKKGSRPSYIKALNGDKASPLYDKFNEELSRYVKVSTGVFGSDMEINFTNIGPVTIIIEK